MSIVSYLDCVKTVEELSARIDAESIDKQLCDLYDIVLNIYTRRYNTGSLEVSQSIASDKLPSMYYSHTFRELHSFKNAYEGKVGISKEEAFQRLLKVRDAVDNLASLVNIKLNWEYSQ